MTAVHFAELIRLEHSLKRNSIFQDTSMVSMILRKIKIKSELWWSTGIFTADFHST